MSLIVDGNLGITFPSPWGIPGGRLTLQSNTPVMTTNQSQKNTIYYSPYQGNMIPIYDGAVFQTRPFVEIFTTTTDTSKNPSAIGVNKVNDWFVWLDGDGVLKLCHGPDWTNDTTRSAGTVLTRINGIWLNAVAITKGPMDRQGTYVGTTHSNSNGLLNWYFGGAAIGGDAAFLEVWNCYNRVDVMTDVLEAASSWSLAAGVSRPFNGSLTNRVSAVFGLAEDTVVANGYASVNQNDSFAFAGIGFNSTNIMASIGVGVSAVPGAWVASVATCSKRPLGFNFWQMLETAGTTNGSIAGQHPGLGYQQSGLQFRARM
jgi:hypothetical protein